MTAEALRAPTRDDAPLLRVLVVEDNEDEAAVAHEFLRQSGFWVATARSIESAAQELEVCGADVVLLDLGLPDASGVTSVRALLGVHYGMPVVVLSGDSSPDVPLKAIDAGADDYIVKGSRWEDIAYALRKAIARATSARRARHVSLSALSVRFERVERAVAELRACFEVETGEASR